jgi:hypothetical protein
MHWIVAGLDRGRFHWSDHVPGWLQGICLFTVAAGYALALWAMHVNRRFIRRAPPPDSPPQMIQSGAQVAPLMSTDPSRAIAGS